MPVSQTYSAENKENSEISTAIISIHVKIKDRIYLLVLNVNVLWTTIHENINFSTSVLLSLTMV